MTINKVKQKNKGRKGKENDNQPNQEIHFQSKSKVVKILIGVSRKMGSFALISLRACSIWLLRNSSSIPVS